MNLPAPFSWLAELAVAIVRMAWATAAHITANIAELGPAWVVAYWLAIAGLWQAGRWGTNATVGVRRGNDVLEFDPTRRGARWLGLAGDVLRWHVGAQAWASTLAEIAGYGGAVALIAIGFFWRWLALVPAIWAIHKITAARRRRILHQRGLVP